VRHRSDFTEDIDDKPALSAVLAAACGLSISEGLDRLEPRISARPEKMQRTVEAAAQMGRAHGLAGAQPYRPLDADGDDSRLMAASGETEPTTHANAGYRVALVTRSPTASLPASTSSRPTSSAARQALTWSPTPPASPVEAERIGGGQVAEGLQGDGAVLAEGRDLGSTDIRFSWLVVAPGW
jgi:hypothetical protein